MPKKLVVIIDSERPRALRMAFKSFRQVDDAATDDFTMAVSVLDCLPSDIHGAIVDLIPIPENCVALGYS